MKDTVPVVGEVVAEAAWRQISEGGPGGMLRITGFSPDEINALVAALETMNLESEELPLKIVVGSRSGWHGLPKRFLLDEETTPTSYRNRRDVTLVYVECDEMSDSQSLRGLPTLDDGSILGSGDEGDRRVLIETTWDHLSPGAGKPPQALVRQLEEVYGALAEKEQVPLRRWISFVTRVAAPLAAVERAADESEVGRRVAAGLPELGMFVDEVLFDEASEARRAHRLQLNYHLSRGGDQKGRPVDSDEIVQVSRRTEFTNREQEVYDPETQKRLRSDIFEHLYPLHQQRPEMELHIWEQLFTEQSKRQGLGTRIRMFLEDSAASRLQEYADLDVQIPLDGRDADAARTLLGATPDEVSEAPLVDLLPVRLRRALERLADPGAKAVSDPLRHLLRELFALSDEVGEEGDSRRLLLGRAASDRRDDRKSIELFAFLYGKTLQSAFATAESSLRMLVEPSKELVAFDSSVLASDSNDLDDDEDDKTNPETGWDPLVLELRWEDDVAATRRFEWRPLEHLGLVALLGLVRQPGSHRWGSGDEEFGSWCRRALDGELPPDDSALTCASGGPTERWLALREEVLTRLQEGIESGSLTDYVNEWQKLLQEIVEDFEPSGSPVPEVDSFLKVDTYRDDSGHEVMLATHPIRLRWVSWHLSELRSLLESVADGSVELNPVNDAFYFELLGNLSPHEQPPIISMGDVMSVAVREEDWHGHFAPLKTRSTSKLEWLSELDDASIDELATVVEDYVDAHPQKSDGVSMLLLVRERGARVVARLLDRSLRGRGVRRSAVVHIVAPASEFPALEDALRPFDDPEERAESDLPRIEAILHEWPAGEDIPKLDALDERVDIAIVPNLFGVHTLSNEATIKEADELGAFKPWSDPTSYVAPQLGGSREGEAENVSRVLLPHRFDGILWNWSTANVRNFRHQKVGDGSDYVTLQVRFDLSKDLYDELHKNAHWVVTLDAFVGRDQIEALEHRPDVIIVRPRVGKGRAFTLVVSSSTGRDFIAARLEHRLEADLPEELRPRVAGMVRAIYDRARDLVPGLLLRALGLGWATQEMIGLIVARSLVEQAHPIPSREGFVAWISLDEQNRWFGPSGNRADLARIVATRHDDRLHVRLAVVESKFREQENVALADRQVKNSLELLEAGLRTGEDEPADARFWRREMLDVIEQSSRRLEIPPHQAAMVAWDQDGKRTRSVTPAVRDLWLDGKSELEESHGVVLTISPGLTSGGRDDEATPGGYKWFRFGLPELARALERMTEEGQVLPSVEPSAEPSGQGGAAPSAEGISSEETSAGPVGEEPARPSAGEARRRKPVEEMEDLYQGVLDTFHEFDVKVRRPDGEAYREGPGFYVLRFRPDEGVRPEAVTRLAPEIKLKLKLPQEFSPRSYIDLGNVVFEVPKTDKERYYIEAQELWERTEFGFERLYAPIGEDIRGEVVGIDFSSSDSPHLLIAGLTGSGKSVALEAILEGLCEHYSPDRLRLALVDPKTTDLADFEGRPHVIGEIGYEAEDAIQILEEAVVEMQRRRDLFRTVRARTLPEYNQKIQESGESEVLPWRVVVLDEYADLTNDKDDRKQIEAFLQRLSQKARASGIHVIVATQKPSAQVISTTVRSNLPAQLALRVKTATDSRIVMDESGAETLAGKGDAFLKTARATTRLQCAEVRRS